MFSEFMTSLHQTLNPNKKFTPSYKLLPTQYDKEHYVVHFPVLKFYLEMYPELRHVHRVIKYKQKAWRILISIVTNGPCQVMISTRSFTET